MVDVRPVRSTEVEPHLGELVALLGERYGAAPWGESAAENAREGRRLVDAADLPGTTTALALAAGRLVGFAQGAPGVVFADDLRRVAPDAARAWPPPVFELHQLVVGSTVAGTGVGGRLHDAVMSRVRTSALLLTHPEAAPALRLYARRGWVTLAETSFGPAHPRVVLGRRPPGTPRGRPPVGGPPS